MDSNDTMQKKLEIYVESTQMPIYVQMYIC